jgi:K+-transporting ATPase ATPase A chain
MTFNGWRQIAIYCALPILLTKPIGGYMTRVFNGGRIVLSPVLRPLEQGLYRFVLSASIPMGASAGVG